MNLPPIQWQAAPSGLFDQAFISGWPLASIGTRGLFGATVRVVGDDAAPVLTLSAAHAAGSLHAVRATLTHRLLDESAGSANTLAAGLALENIGDAALSLEIEFQSSVRPSPAGDALEIFLPLTANGVANHPVLGGHLGKDQRVESRLPLRPLDCFAAHYLEPLLSDANRETAMPLLVPVIALCEADLPWAISFYASPERGWRIAHHGTPAGESYFSLRTRLVLAPGERREESAFWSLHAAGPVEGWAAFHRHAHHDPHPPIPWTRQVRVHHYDFLSAARADLPRGEGYLEDVKHFREFHVGMGTQHGYYVGYGDFIHPDRPEWLAMPGDVRGPVPMSLAELRRRIALTREQGAKAAIYIHLAALDDASVFWPALKDACQRGPDGQPVVFPWKGPDIAGVMHHMSMADPRWREHLLQQTRWIFELLDPDAIVIDESFGGLGYDWHPDRSPVLSTGTIDFMKRIRALARSFGPDKAVFGSDCAVSGFALWLDGEAADHAYDVLLGHSEYRREPVKYRAVLGAKPWIPCAWLWRGQWENQLDLARKTGAGVGTSAGWTCYSGLTQLTAEARARYLADIQALETFRSP
jgi:hypothetical protein